MRVLLVTATADYHHDSIPTIHRVIPQFGDPDPAFAVTLLASATDLTRFTPALLAEHDVVVFASTTGDLPLDAVQKQALLDFVRGGGGFVGVHSAAATFAGWTEYTQMLGGSFKEHPWTQTARIIVEDLGDPATQHLVPAFELTEELYTFTENPRPNVHVLLRLDPASVGATGDFPLAWKRPYGDGRVFYTALGHFPETWDDVRFQRHLLEGIRWAAGEAATATLPAPRLDSPASGAVLPGVGPVNLFWTNPPGTTQYHLRVVPHSGDGPGISTIIGDPPQVASPSQSIPAPVMGLGFYTLLPGMTYSWQVRVSDAPDSLGPDDARWGRWSPAFTFRTAARDSSHLRLAYPGDGTVMGADAVTLGWENTDRDVFYYEIQFSADPTFETDPVRATAAVAWNLVHGGVTVPPNSWRTPPLEAGRIYYWRVRPRVQGDGAPVAWSPANSFRTIPVETVVQNVAHPWSLAFAPDGRLFFTAAPDTVQVLVPETGGGYRIQPEPVIRLKVFPVNEGGVRGLAIDPDFSQNGFLYLYYTYRDAAGQLLNRLSRITERNGRADSERVLLDAIPGGVFHNAGRLRFGPDGMLWLTTGDTANHALPQDVASLAGKTLRVARDGTVPADNPFPGSPVVTLGHRNAQGLAWHPDTGALFSTEHGPSDNVESGECCHDELNLVERGRNYGWPLAAGLSSDARFTPPLLESGEDTWAPSGADFFRSPSAPEWHGNLFFAALRGMHLHRVALGGSDYRQVKRHERWFERQYGRLRAAEMGPDGYFYFSTSNGGNDRILRFRPPTPR